MILYPSKIDKWRWSDAISRSAFGQREPPAEVQMEVSQRGGLTRIERPCRVMRRGAVAQLGECLTGSQEVASSILASSTNKINNLKPSSNPSKSHIQVFGSNLVPLSIISGEVKPSLLLVDAQQKRRDSVPGGGGSTITLTPIGRAYTRAIEIGHATSSVS